MPVVVPADIFSDVSSVISSIMSSDALLDVFQGDCISGTSWLENPWVAGFGELVFDGKSFCPIDFMKGDSKLPLISFDRTKGILSGLSERLSEGMPDNEPNDIADDEPEGTSAGTSEGNPVPRNTHRASFSIPASRPESFRGLHLASFSAAFPANPGVTAADNPAGLNAGNSTALFKGASARTSEGNPDDVPEGIPE